MTSKYLDMLEDSLRNKKDILEKLTELSNRQKDIVKEAAVDWEQFDLLVDEKGALIDRLENLDNGFEAVYNRIREDVSTNKDKYKDSLINIQKLISAVTEASTRLMALERRNKTAIEASFNNERTNISQVKKTSEVAANYYKSMSRVNFIDPQLMDRKK